MPGEPHDGDLQKILHHVPYEEEEDDSGVDSRTTEEESVRKRLAGDEAIQCVKLHPHQYDGRHKQLMHVELSVVADFVRDLPKFPQNPR